MLKKRRAGSKSHSDPKHGYERPTVDQDYCTDPEIARHKEKQRTVFHGRVIRKSIPGH